MDTNNRKAVLMVLLLLLCESTSGANPVSECCRHPSPSCRLYLLLCRPAGLQAGDAAAGILTLGKRSGEEYRLQSRLNHLLHGQRNQAAGILTMGKRTTQQDWMEHAEISTTLPA
ncbi:orexin [Boleophthalmus pectinirostris]|uniref:orexin n=1 Tax=Boleophthalmus pectinirostris TaxID=150288 RepID=UPI000A1C3C5E|nr:orexin [Boleophthalmus pectinirostris]